MSEQLNLFDELAFFEGVDLEYKGARGGLPRSLWETYSAFANTGGGTIWLGITQRDVGLDAHGVPDAERLLGDFWATVNNRNKVSLNLLREQDVRIISLATPERRVIRIDVPRADRRQRPVFIGPDPLRGTYRRNFEGDFLCTETEVRRMFADQAEEPADSRILQGFTLEDVHSESLRQFRNLFGARSQHVWLGEDDQGLLEKLGGWRRDRKSGEVGLTLAGLLMFGREQAIRDPDAVPAFQLDYRERFSDDPSVRWTDRLTLDGTWEGNLFQFYQRVMLQLSSGPGVKRPFQTNAGGYRVADTPVTEALQEALVNALIHADYLGQGGIVIDRYQDRFEFSNPGTLLLSREQLLRGGISECRNKSLQLMFQMLGAGDKAGSGIDKIRSSWAAEHWQAPILSERFRPDRVVLELPMVSTLPEHAVRALRERFGADFEQLGPDEGHALVTAYIEGEITNMRLQDMLSLHRVDITAMLRDLVRSGLLISDGTGRGTRYSIPLGAHVATDIPHVATDIPHVGSDEPARAEQELSRLTSGLSEDQKRVVVRVRQTQAPQELTRQAIRMLCRDRYLTARELGSILGRNPDGLRDRFLTKMVASNELQARFPGARRRRDQAYLAAPSEGEDQ